MTNDYRGVPLSSHTVRLRCTVNFDITEDVLAHTEQDALDSIDECAVKENLVREYDELFSDIVYFGVVEATIVERDDY